MSADDDVLFTINIKDSLDELLGKLDDLAADQLPFALGGALYDVALKARDVMRVKARSVFTIRSPKPWAERALTFDVISKKRLRDKIKLGDNPSISIISKDQILGPLLTDGGTRKRTDGKELGVPIVGGARKTIQSKLTRKTGLDGLLKNNPRTLLIKAKDGRRLAVTYPGKYKKGIPKAQQHKAMFHVRKSVNIKPWWNARDILAQAMLTWFPEKFEAAYRLAMETRK